MPYTKRKLKGGRLELTNVETGEKRTFGNATKATNWQRMAEATKHGFKPTGKGKHL